MTERSPLDSIHFASGDWAAVAQTELVRFGSDPAMDLSVPWRIFFLAIGRTDRSGHVPFRQGELRALLRTVDKDTGEVGPVSPATVSRGLRKAKELGLIAADSSASCVVLPPHLVQKRKGAVEPSCHVHEAKPKASRRRRI